MSDVGDMIAVGLRAQPNGLGLTASEAHRIGEEIAAHIAPLSELRIERLRYQSYRREDLAEYREMCLEAESHGYDWPWPPPSREWIAEFRERAG
jgi:hypothetical protein